MREAELRVKWKKFFDKKLCVLSVASLQLFLNIIFNKEINRI